jgi:cobalt-zinc-cadmium resistance protein CzcA
MDKEKLTRDDAALQQQFPGVDFNFSQYIQDNVEEAASGVKGENSVKVYGNDLETLEKTAANAIAAVLAKVPGITDLAVLRSLGQPTIRIDVDRVRAARYGLAPGDVNAVVQTAIGGQSAGDLVRRGQRPALSDDGAPGGALIGKASTRSGAFPLRGAKPTAAASFRFR